MDESRPRSHFDELYAQYRALPEHTSAEIVGGEVRLLPRPRPRHVRAAARLYRRLASAYTGTSTDRVAG